MKELPTMNTTAFYYVHEAQDHVLEKYYSSETEQTTNDVKFEIVRKHSGKLEMVSIFLCFLFCFAFSFTFSCFLMSVKKEKVAKL